MANDEMLRAMAAHRGFRLVKSRRRKPGSGDYGRYGLTDAGGKKCFGFGKTGLTATSAQIESYLRSIESSSWRRSIGAARATPAKKPVTPKRTAASEPRPETATRPAKRIPPRRTRPAVATAKSKPAKPVAPSAALAIREATSSDAAAIGRLLRTLRPAPSAASLRSRLSALLGAGEPPLLADRDGVIGCVG